MQDFGAFIDLGGGIQGLLHVSEMSWSRLTSPGEMVAVGDQITVKVLRVDDATQKISLGLKQLQDDPWSTSASAYAVGQVRTGRVTRVADFGAFVELEPGIEGLAHASTFPPTGRPQRLDPAVPVGHDRAPSKCSASISPRSESAWRWSRRERRAPRARSRRAASSPARIVTGKVERHETFGVFVFLAPGRTGLMPFSETGLDRDADMVKAFPDRQRRRGRRCWRSMRVAGAFA